jgi:putative MATE family efflux protein
MKKTLNRYVNEVTHDAHGETHASLLWYFMPEFVTNLIVYSMPLWLDAVFIGALKSTPAYATLGVTNNIIHLVIKIAEALAVSTIVLSGQHNGQGEYKRVGAVMKDAFWTTCLVGIFFCCLLFFGGESLYRWYGVQPDIILLGLPYIKIRALGVLFMFIYFAFVGFLRGIKNTRSPMKIFISGAIIFILSDYVLIFGKYGFAEYGLQGSAIATLLQYSSMSLIALLYILFNHKNRKYGVSLFSGYGSWDDIIRFAKVSTPIVMDKASIAIAYIWLGIMIAPMGTNALAAFSAIKDMERFAFLPAIAWAQVITFIVSNNIGSRDVLAVKVNIKKVLWMSCIMVCILLMVMVKYSSSFLLLFDKKGDFTSLVSAAFPIISGFVLLDLLQIILSGALRGSGHLWTVMIVRSVMVFGFFIPISTFFSYCSIESDVLKILLIYGSFYISNGLMSLWYIKIFRGKEWTKNCSIA